MSMLGDDLESLIAALAGDSDAGRTGAVNTG